MKSIVFDSGPIISLGLNSMLGILKPLKEKYGGEFYITQSVRSELVDIPIKGKKFKLEAFQVEEQIRLGVLKVVHDEHIMGTTRKLLDIANNTYFSNDQPINVVQFGEISSLALACHLRADAVVIDERATRDLLEDPENLTRRLAYKLGTQVKMNPEFSQKWRRELCDLRVIRSVELATVAFESNMFANLIPPETRIKNPRQEFLEALLWGIKLNGCSVSEKEIARIMKIEF